MNDELNRNSANNPHLFEDDEGNRFVGKRNRADHPLLIANEFIFSRLAQEVGLFALPTQIEEIRGDDFLLWPYREMDTLPAFGRQDLKARLREWTDLILLLCFDMLVFNQDRHARNIHFAKIDGDIEVCAHDHDQALYSKAPEGEVLRHRVRTPCRHLAHDDHQGLIQQLDPDEETVLRCVEKCAEVPRERIRGIVFDLKDSLLGEGKDTVVSTLLDRQHTLESCVRSVMEASGAESFVEAS